jgi:hypothetical protein
MVKRRFRPFGPLDSEKEDLRQLLSEIHSGRSGQPLAFIIARHFVHDTLSPGSAVLVALGGTSPPQSVQARKTPGSTSARWHE